MTLIAPRVIVIPASPAARNCEIRVKLITDIVIRVRLDCVSSKRDDVPIHLDQGSVSNFTFTAGSSVDLSGATELIFTMRQGGKSGAEIYRKTLSGGDISLISDYQYRFTPTNAEADAWPAGRHYYETWTIDSGGIQHQLGQGPVIVNDTVEFD